MNLVRLLSGLALFGLVLGCGDSIVIGKRVPNSCDLAPYPEPGDRNVSIDILTFWNDRAEDEAFKALTADHEQVGYSLYEGEENDRLAQQQNLRTSLISDASNLPDAYNANGGSDILQWAHKDSVVPSEICSLQALDDLYGWSDPSHFFGAAIDPVTCRGQLYALPLGVHRVNLLFYNEQVIGKVERALGTDRPVEEVLSALSTPEAFVDYLQTIHGLKLKSLEQDSDLVAISIGSYDTWPLGILAFDDLIAAVDLSYEALWMGYASVSDQEGEKKAAKKKLESDLGRWLMLLEKIVASSNLASFAGPSKLDEGVEKLSWGESLKLVASGHSAFSAMGDWGWAELLLEGTPHGVGAIAFPGTGAQKKRPETFVYTPDTFAVPRRSKHDGTSPHFWLKEVIDNKDKQILFANAKQSIPARSDLSEQDLKRLREPRLRETYRMFAECQEKDQEVCRLLLAVSGLGTALATHPCFNEVPQLLFAALDLDLTKEAGFGLGGSGGEIKEEASKSGRLCSRAFPSTSSEAKEVLIARLLEIAEQPFAADCRSFEE